ncbi:MAG: molybdenum cofactor guanylyltransferase [Armatimonadetes bacterium]|nr:molybdenum cofactor guanylyltransferase [Armatimonadota bacterium]
MSHLYWAGVTACAEAMLAKHAGAIILAGGYGRRLTKQKGLLQVGGLSIAERVIEAAKTAVGDLVVVGEAHLPPGTGVRVVPDDFPGGGPTHGLWVGLRALDRPVAVLMAWDMPFLTAGLLSYLIQSLEASQDNQAAVPRIQGRPQPLCAAYRHSCAEVLENMNRGVNVAMKDLLARLSVRWVSEEELGHLGPPEKLLFSVNTPRDLDQARRWAEENRDC